MERQYIETLEVLSQVYPMIYRISSPEIVGAFIGTLCDFWASDHGVEADEMQELLETLAKVRKDVLKSLGMPPRMKGENNE